MHHSASIFSNMSAVSKYQCTQYIMKLEARKSGLHVIRGWVIFEWSYASYQLYECVKLLNVILLFSKSSWPNSEDPTNQVTWGTTFSCNQGQQQWSDQWKIQKDLRDRWLCYFLKNNWIPVQWKAPQIDREPKTENAEKKYKNR